MSDKDNNLEIFGVAAEKMLRSKAFLDVFIKLVAEEYRRSLLEIAGENSINCYKSSHAQIKDRNKKIRMAFNGENQEQLSQEFNLGLRQVRRICRTK